jgi:hypothetical protein
MVCNLLKPPTHSLLNRLSLTQNDLSLREFSPGANDLQIVDDKMMVYIFDPQRLLL